MYSTPNIIWASKSRRMCRAVHVARVGEMRHAYRISLGKTKEKKPLGKPRRRWDDNLKMDLQEMGSGTYEYTGLIWFRTRRGDGLL
jgi:hypothetical protein